jgi:nitrate reductase gamma subunit
MNVWYSLGAVILLILFSFIGAGGFGWHTFFAVVVPYAAAAMFIIGLVYRVVKWARAPVPFHIPTTCGQQKTLPWIKSDKVESPTSTLGVIWRLTTEVLLFRSLFRNEKVQLENRRRLIFRGNRFLWLGGLAFHLSLLVILFRHSRLFMQPVIGAVDIVGSIDNALQGLWQGLLPTLFISDLVILAALTYLVIRRLIYPQTRYISLASDYFALFLLLGVVVCGALVRLFYRVDIEGVKELAMGIITFHPVVPTGVNAVFYTHIFLVSVLVAYFPFSKMMHAAGILLSPTRNLKNNSRMKRHINPWNPAVKVHTYQEWEDEYREAMRGVGLPLEKE